MVPQASTPTALQGALSQSTVILFCITVLAFISLEARAADTITVEKLIQSSQSWDGSTLPQYPVGQPEITLLRITVPPHAALSLHKHPVINAGLLLEGSLIVTDIDGNQLKLHAGDPIVELVDKWHYGKNPSDTPAVILVFYASVEGTPVTLLHPPTQESE